MKKTINPVFVSALTTTAPEAVKANFHTRHPSTNQQGSVAYIQPSTGITYPWASGWTKSIMNEIEVAEDYMLNTYSWWGAHPFHFFATGGHNDPSVTDYVRATFKFTTLESRLDDILNQESDTHPFLGPLVRDTINFVLTGKRQMPIRLMYEFMLEHYTMTQDNKYEGPFEVPITIRPRGDVRELHGLSTQEFFLRWVRQKGGVEDIIATHKMLFGL
jgi:hypothetical protein